MTEQQLQQKCVTWFHNTYPECRGMLFMVKNETNKGANYAPLGLVRGVSDLVFIDPCGFPVFIELKAEGTRHKVEHLKEQHAWLTLISQGVAVGLFCSDFGIFQKIIKSRIGKKQSNFAKEYSSLSLQYAEMLTKKKTKTVKWALCTTEYTSKEHQSSM